MPCYPTGANETPWFTSTAGLSSRRAAVFLVEVQRAGLPHSVTWLSLSGAQMHHLEPQSHPAAVGLPAGGKGHGTVERLALPPRGSYRVNTCNSPLLVFLSLRRINSFLFKPSQKTTEAVICGEPAVGPARNRK